MPVSIKIPAPFLRPDFEQVKQECYCHKDGFLHKKKGTRTGPKPSGRSRLKCLLDGKSNGAGVRITSHTSQTVVVSLRGNGGARQAVPNQAGTKHQFDVLDECRGIAII
jgi:hypothetical protein